MMSCVRRAGLGLVLSLGLIGPAQAEGLEVVAELGLDAPPGNIAITPDGRMFLSLHAFYGPEFRVVELFEDGSTQPYPDEDWATPPDAAGVGLNNVLGLRADATGVVWFLDNAGNGQPGRLVGWDTTTEQLHRIYPFPEASVPEGAFLNDFAIDRTEGVAYIADTGNVLGGDPKPALVILDLETGQSRRILEGHVTQAAEDIDLVVDGQTAAIDGMPVRVGADSITLHPSGRWLYFGPLTGTTLYVIDTRALRDFDLPEAEIAADIERYGVKPLSDGITVDSAGNVYITDITTNAIGVVDPEGGYRILHQDATLLSWPDGFAYGPDDFIYATVNQLHRSPVLAGDLQAEPPFYIVRFEPLDHGTWGR